MTIVTKNSLTLSNVNDGTAGIPGPKGMDGTDAPTITVKSYTFSAGSRAEIELTGPNAFKKTVYNRGHNVWVIDATTHELREFVSCDTYTSMSFNQNGVSMTLADYLSSLRDSIVVIAASDADSVDQNVRDVLNPMGGSPDLGTWFGRVGHVFIGMSKRTDGTWPLQPRQGYEEAINKDGSAPEIGCTLSKGGIVANGASGPKGDDGKTQYTHIAYANSADGVTDFSTSDSNRAYIGMYVDFNINDSTTPSDYSWTLVKGADGTQGTPGKPGADGKTPYFHTAWAYSVDGTDRFTTVYPNLNLITGTSGPFIMRFGIPNTTWNTTTQVSEISLPVTAIYNEVLPQSNDFNYRWSPGVTYTQSIYISTDAPLTGTPLKFTWFTNEYGHNTSGIDKLIKVSTNIYIATSTYTWPSSNSQSVGRNADLSNLTQAFDLTKGTFLQFYKPKLELGSTATPYMPSSSEVTTADWPSYIGQYTDFTQDDSTNPSDYTWSLIRGNDGQNSYTHTAYSWSADGTDGFTTIYPNLNLLDFNSGVTLGKHYGWAADTTTYSGNRAYFKKVKVTPNNQYTISANWLNTSWLNVYGFANESDTVAVARYGSGNGQGTGFWDSSFVGGFTVAKNMTFTVPANVNYIGVSYCGVSTDTLTLQALLNGKPKLEKGSISTPWMPSSSEVKTSDYPNYIGTYSDSNVESSLDYSKYQWAIFKGQNSNAYTAYSWSSDGTDRFSTVYPNLNLLNGSSAKTKDGFFKDFDKVENGYGEVTRKGNNSYAYINMWDGFSIQPRDYKPNDIYTMSMDVMFTSWNLPAGTTLTEFWIGQRYSKSTDGSINSWKHICDIDLPRDPSQMLNQWIRITKTSTIPPYEDPAVNTEALFMTKFTGASEGSFTVRVRKPKQEVGSVTTPYMPSESEAQDQWQDAIPMYVGVGEKDSQNPSDYRWQLNPRYVQASSDSGLSNKAGVDDLASVADTANDALVQAQNAVSNEDYTSWLEHDYQSTINNLQDVSTKNQEDIKNVDDRTTIVEGFYGEMKVKWNFIDESFSFSEEGMFISNAQSKMSIQITSDKIVFWDNNVDVAFITGEVLNIQKGVFLESATIGNHLITKFSDDSPVTIIRYVGGIT